MNTENVPRRWPIVTIILALLTIASFFYFSDFSPQYGIEYGVAGMRAIPPTPAASPTYDDQAQTVTTEYGSGSSASAPTDSSMSMQAMGGTPEVANISANYYHQPVYPGYGGNVSATDTREFQKISYSATMQTRDVQGLTRRTETIVRGHNGRVDNISSSMQYGSVTFVVPQTSYQAFRDEIESLVDSRFLTVSINSQNLLPQKVSIEQQQTYTQKNLDELQSQRSQAVTSHSAKVRSLQSQITDNKAQQAALNAEVPADDVRANAISTMIAQLSNDLSALQSRLASENSQYSYQIASFDQEIKWAKDSLAGVKQQDQNLLDNVATVDGTISFQWISWRDIIHSYLPGYSITLILGVLTLISYYFERRRSVRVL